MDIAETEQEEEWSEWVVIQTSTSDVSTPPHSPILQPSHRREDPTVDDDDEYSIVSGEEEEGDSSSTVNHSLPWRVMETAKKRLKESGFFFQAVVRGRFRNYVTRKRVYWSFIGGFILVSSLVYVKFVRWWRRLQEEKLSFLLSLLREKDQKIKELMLEIGRLNELLSSRRRVRVVRIV